MITGSVNARREATLRLWVFGPTGQAREVTAVIDTGYNGTLTLPSALINTLALTPAISRRVQLADGSLRVLNSFLAQVLWDGQRRRVEVLTAEGRILLGTALLAGYHLGIDFVNGGGVNLNRVP